MSSTQIKLVVFDLDGTLLNSVPDLAKATDEAMQAMGRQGVTLEQVSCWIGNGADNLVMRALSQGMERSADVTDEDIRTARQHFDHYYHIGGHQLSHLYPNVKKVLTALKQKSIHIALLTNKPSQFVPSILTKHGIAEFFDDVIGGDDFPVKKPDPFALNMLAEKYNLDKSQILMVGDSKNDIQAAKNAACLSFALTYGYNHGEPIQDAKPDFIADDLIDLLQHI